MADFRYRPGSAVAKGSYAYGIYINGKGGDDYYLFRIRPNDNCGWKLFKRKDGNNSTVKEGGCDSAINRAKVENILKIEHFQGGTISVYVNNKLLFSGNENWFPGKGTGVYVEADDDKGTTVRFDDFTILGP